MSNDNIEPISAKLRRWADESYESGMYPTERSEIELRVDGVGQMKAERELFRHIADEIDREKREITERYARQSWMNPADAIAKLATGEIEWAELQQAIERYYLPRPLFEDGDPVYIGAEIDDRRRGKLEVSRICYTDGGFYFNNSRGSNGRKMKGIKYKHGERVGRPKQHVLDADGVPIEVGDAVWNLSDSTKWEVEKIHSTEPRISIRQLDTDKDVTGGWFLASNYSHREPDSQERIDMDAQESSHDYWKCYGHACSKCPAMFDGKIPSEHYGVSTCLKAQKLDLLRRQRELDGRDA